MDLNFSFLDEFRDNINSYISYFLIGFIVFLFINFGLLFLILFHILDMHSIIEGMKTCVMAVRL